MTLHAFRLPEKVEPSPKNREQVYALAVYGETREVAMNDDRTNIRSVPLAAADTRTAIAVV
ncbi:hypothetical protein FHX14_000472 [Rhizobium sp. BK619]|uniref:hypothetical protein n=1 Tax=Rhizobium sp. BK619 TaxID=2586989 RepID=UPI001618BD93|nr:hypothetical protein [Rhizobium sp. BK619]MBB3644313.1 hypothetical protein [Rhizobium sp. BK619]